MTATASISTRYCGLASPETMCTLIAGGSPALPQASPNAAKPSAGGRRPSRA